MSVSDQGSMNLHDHPTAQGSSFQLNIPPRPVVTLPVCLYALKGMSGTAFLRYSVVLDSWRICVTHELHY